MSDSRKIPRTRKSLEPLPKRRRDFSIDYILNQAGGGRVKGYDYYIQKLTTENDKNEKFKMNRSRTKFVMQNFEELDDPTEMLRQCFQRSIDETLELNKANSTSKKEEDDQPDRIGININSENLEKDINIPFSQMTENTVDAIFNRFQHIQQSRKNAGASLLGKPFTITINLLNKTKLPSSRRTAGKGKRKLAEVKHNIDPQKLISIENTQDTYCLFYVLVVMKEYTKDYLSDKKLTRLQFFNFKKNIQ